MTKQANLVCCLLVLAFAAASAGLAADPKLVNEKPIFEPGVSYGGSGEAMGIGCMRLSPDARYVLYVRLEKDQPKPENYQGRWRGALFRPVLRDLKSGTETVLPVPAFSWDDPLTNQLSRCVFGVSGTMIALGIGIDADKDGVVDSLFDYRGGHMQAVLYEIATGAIQPLPVSEEIVLPMFVRGGKELLILTARERGLSAALYSTPADRVKLKKLSQAGLLTDVCPSADVVPLLLPKREREPAERRRLALYDLKADKLSVELPIDEKNTDLPDFPPRWTANGRFLYYMDLEGSQDKAGSLWEMVTRVWDREGGKEAHVVDSAFPVGPGPTPTTMVMGRIGRPWIRQYTVARTTPMTTMRRRGKPALFLHDAVTGSSWTLVEGRLRFFFAGDGKVLYAKKGKDRKWVAYLAEISMPADAK